MTKHYDVGAMIYVDIDADAGDRAAAMRLAICHLPEGSWEFAREDPASNGWRFVFVRLDVRLEDTIVWHCP